MNKFISYFFVLLLTVLACPTYAKNVAVTYDFSQIKLDVPADAVDTYNYKNMGLAWVAQADGALAPGWDYRSVEQLIKTPFISSVPFDGDYMTTQYVGVVDSLGKQYSNPPASCLPVMHNGDVLHISGILHVPADNNSVPYIENLNCKLN